MKVAASTRGQQIIKVLNAVCKFRGKGWSVTPMTIADETGIDKERVAEIMREIREP